MSDPISVGQSVELSLNDLTERSVPVTVADVTFIVYDPQGNLFPVGTPEHDVDTNDWRVDIVPNLTGRWSVKAEAVVDATGSVYRSPVRKFWVSSW